jgi:hypothetical protein
MENMGIYTPRSNGIIGNRLQLLFGSRLALGIEVQFIPGNSLHIERGSQQQRRGKTTDCTIGHDNHRIWLDPCIITIHRPTLTNTTLNVYGGEV